MSLIFASILRGTLTSIGSCPGLKIEEEDIPFTEFSSDAPFFLPNIDLEEPLESIERSSIDILACCRVRCFWIPVKLPGLANRSKTLPPEEVLLRGGPRCCTDLLVDLAGLEWIIGGFPSFNNAGGMSPLAISAKSAIMSSAQSGISSSSSLSLLSTGGKPLNILFWGYIFPLSLPRGLSLDI